MALHKFTDITLDVLSYTDTTGLMTGRNTNNEIVFELQYNSKLFNVVSNDKVELIIGVNVDDDELESSSDYAIVAAVAQTNWRDNPPHFIISSGGMIGRFYLERKDIESIIDVGNDCRVYFKRL